MLETPHVAVGAAIAVKVGNPFLAIPLAFASHFILEKVPHWNPHLNTETKKYGHPSLKSTIITAVDSTTALVLGSYFAFRTLPDTGQAITVFLACFAAVLPDVLEAPYFFLNFRSKTAKKWIAFQKSIQADTSPLPGLATQIITLFAAISWIFIN